MRQHTLLGIVMALALGLSGCASNPPGPRSYADTAALASLLQELRLLSGVTWRELDLGRVLSEWPMPLSPSEQPRSGNDTRTVFYRSVRSATEGRCASCDTLVVRDLPAPRLTGIVLFERFTSRDSAVSFARAVAIAALPDGSPADAEAVAWVPGGRQDAEATFQGLLDNQIGVAVEVRVFEVLGTWQATGTVSQVELDGGGQMR